MFLKKLRQSLAISRIAEEELYAQAVKELENGIRREGLWAKALANSDGVENKAKALYLKYRTQAIKDELEIISGLQQDITRVDDQIKRKYKKQKFVENIEANRHIGMIAYMLTIGWSEEDILNFFERNNISCLLKGGWSEKVIGEVIKDFKLRDLQ